MNAPDKSDIDSSPLAAAIAMTDEIFAGLGAEKHRADYLAIPERYMPEAAMLAKSRIAGMSGKALNA